MSQLDLAAMDDHSLVGALRAGNESAVAAFIARFHRLLLAYARRAAWSEPESDVLVEEVLGDLVMTLMQPDAPPPTHLAGYVVGAFRHRLLNERRARRRRESLEEQAALDIVTAGQDPKEQTRSAVVHRLAAALTEQLTPDERQLLAWVSEFVPQRQIAGWLGISHAAVRKRIERLRVRLVAASRLFDEGTSPEDAAELRRFYRRSGADVRGSVTSRGGHQ